MVGQTILQYHLLEKLGAGGMGEIYKAHDTRLNRLVAIKMLSPAMASDPERRRRFFQEAQAASALNHPNIITLHDIVSDGDTQCIVMEYVAGKTLREVIPAPGLAAPLALQYAVQMAGALSAAHAAGIVHRDMKPSNVMITDSGLVKILDFGLAKWVGPLAPQGTDAATVDQAEITREGSIIGTMSYMSPEQAVGKRVDARSDIFAFGSVLYEMVTGRRAFEGTSGISTLSSILRDDVKSIYESAPDVPPQLEQIILRCLPKDPDARWQSMKDVEAALTGLERQLGPAGQFGSAPTAVPAAVPAAAPQSAKPAKPAAPAKAAVQKKSSRPLGLAVGLVALVVVAAAGGWWWWKNQQKPAAPAVAQVVAPPAATPAPPPPEPQASTPVPLPEPVIPTPAPVASAPSAPSSKKTPAARKSPGVSPTPSAPAPIPAPPPASSNAPAPVAPPPPAPEEAPQPKRAPRPTAQLTPVTVSDALPFRIALADDVASDAPEGQALRFTVLEDFKIGDVTILAKGAVVNGSITHLAGKKKFLGIGGAKMSFRLLQADAVDGKKINVRATAGKPADGSAERPFDTGKGSRPKGLAAAQGTEYIGYVDGEQAVAVRK
jgi:hypothetical protein